MSRAFLVVLLVAVGAALAGAAGGDPQGGGYVLRAQFDNGSGLRTGMDVRVSGIEIGRVRTIELDQQEPTMPHAVAVIDVTSPAGEGFKQDGSCAIRSATLLGDRYVDCKLGKAGPALATEDGAHLMPVAQTSSPVDPDLMFDIFRLPVRQRLSILINELGAGLAGNGPALNEAIRRANPAFLQLDRTLEVLSGQRRALARLADSSDRVLEPLSRERERLAGFVVHGNELLESVGERREALRATFRRMPAFLRELRPTLSELQGLGRRGRAGAGRPRRRRHAAEPTRRGRSSPRRARARARCARSATQEPTRRTACATRSPCSPRWPSSRPPRGPCGRTSTRCSRASTRVAASSGSWSCRWRWA